MEPIRLATPEEVERIRKEADLDQGCSVLAWAGKEGVDLAVLRNCTEVDPVFYDAGSPNSRKAMFLWGIENMIRMTGVPFYYFNIDSEDEQWNKVVQSWGGEQTTKKPQFRYKKLLMSPNVKENRN